MLKAFLTFSKKHSGEFSDDCFKNEESKVQIFKSLSLLLKTYEMKENVVPQKMFTWGFAGRRIVRRDCDLAHTWPG